MTNRGQLRDRQGGRSILDIALGVHMHVTGSCDSNPTDIELDADLLVETLSVWEPSSPRSQRFDEAVRSVVLASVSEWNRYKEERCKTS